MSQHETIAGSQRLAGVSLVDMLGIAFTVVSLAMVVAVHLTWLPVPIQSVGHLMTNAVGQEMRWTMFATDPNGTAVYMWADVERADGTTVTWAPDKDVIGGDLRSYRPYRWVERVMFAEPSDQLAALAAWLDTEVDGSVIRVRIYGSEQIGVSPAEERPAPEVRLLWDTGGADPGADS